MDGLFSEKRGAEDMKKRNIDWRFYVALSYPIVAVVLIIVLLYNYYYLDVSYQVECLNSEKKNIDSEESYIFFNERNVYLYNFETEETELIYDGFHTGRILSVSIYGDYLYFSDMFGPELHRYNYRTNEDEKLVWSKDDIVKMDICNGYLVYRTWGEDCFLYPVTGDTEEDPISAESIFGERGDKTNQDIQTITYEGMDFVGYFEADTGRTRLIGIRNHENGKEIAPPRKVVLALKDGRYLAIWGREFGGEVNCYAEYEGDEEWYDITCLYNKDFGKEPVFYEKYMTQEGNEVICLLQKSDSEYGSWLQRHSRGDLLFKWNTETGESSILYETSNRRTRIIGYKNGNIYLLYNNQVSVQPVDGGKREKLFRIPMWKRVYSFDWQGDYLIVTGADGKVFKAYKITD